MEVYVARQPIFDRNMHVAGYELLYRRSMSNFYEGLSHEQATADLINNAFLVMQLRELTGGTRAFINFSGEMLLKEIPLLLPKESLVVEVLEKVEATGEIRAALQKLRARGYTIALDDFTFEEASLPLMDLADFVKVEYPAVSRFRQTQFLTRYRGRLKFLAEKVETREDYQAAMDMGYDYFQGYFFSRPVIEKRKEITSFPETLLRMMNELSLKDPNFQVLTEIIETDVGLSYKLLRLAGSVYFGTRGDICTVKQALVRLGIIEMKKWVYLLLLKNIQRAENQELMKNCLIRAKFMELAAQQISLSTKNYYYFLAGLFSSVDVLLDCPMEEAVKELAISPEVRDALMGRDNDIRKAFRVAQCFEMGWWDKLEEEPFARKFDREKLMGLYMSALEWAGEQDL